MVEQSVKQTNSQNVVSKGFVRLAFSAVAVTFIMIIIGAIVRVSKSGMGCGTDWFTCNGQVIPEFTHYTVAIEYGHRLFALLVGGFGMALLIQALRNYRHIPRIMIPVAAGAVLYLVQAGLGGLTVKLSNQWVSVLLHLGTAMLLLSTLLVAWVNALHAHKPLVTTSALKLSLRQVIVGTLLTFAVAMIGAAVAGNNATKACVGWPLCMGQVWPAQQGPLQVLNMTHRLIAGSLGLVLLYLIIRAWQAKDGTIRRVLGLAGVMYLIQAGIGAAVVLVHTADADFIAQALHVTFAAATWAVMIVASTLVWLQQQSNKVSTGTVNQPERVAAPSATTFS
jgi:heme A synthase